MRQEHSSLLKEGQYLQPHFRQNSNQRYPQPSKQPMVRIHKANNSRARNYVSQEALDGDYYQDSSPTSS